MTQPESSMLPVLRLKEVHELMTRQRQLAQTGISVSTANMRQIRDISMDLINMSYEIHEIVLTHDPSLTECKY